MSHHDYARAGLDAKIYWCDAFSQEVYEATWHEWVCLEQAREIGFMFEEKCDDLFTESMA